MNKARILSLIYGWILGHWPGKINEFIYGAFDWVSSVVCFIAVSTKECVILVLDYWSHRGFDLVEGRHWADNPNISRIYFLILIRKLWTYYFNWEIPWRMLEGKINWGQGFYIYEIPLVLHPIIIPPKSMPFQRYCVKCMISWIFFFFNIFNRRQIFSVFTDFLPKIFTSPDSLRCCLSKVVGLNYILIEN